MNYWYIADTHFGHVNVLNFDKRPFSSIEEHDETIVKNWNSVVEPTDTVYHLGDLAYRCPKIRMKDIFSRLNGHKKLILGNHDNKDTRNLITNYGDEWDWELIGPYYEQKFNSKDVFGIESIDFPQETLKGDMRVILCHYPIGSWNKMARGSWHVHGHCHGNYELERGKMIDVGVNVEGMNYTPISFQELRFRMSLKRFERVDGHDKRDEE